MSTYILLLVCASIIRNALACSTTETSIIAIGPDIAEGAYMNCGNIIYVEIKSTVVIIGKAIIILL